MMSTEALAEFQAKKKVIREQAHENRNNQEQKDELSEAICRKFLDLPEYDAAKCVMFYVDVRSEVRTRQSLPAALASGKKIVVPYCVDGELELFWLENMDELSLGMYRILEPKAELRTGARMGHGKGYYDKLLEHARPETPLVALAFECQLFPEIPTADHDVFMDKIVTEAAVYPGKGRK